MDDKKIIYIPVGISGSGKSTFCRENFIFNGIVSSDTCREIVSGDEANQKCSRDAFELFHFIIEKKMKWNQVVVADATNLKSKARKNILDIAKRFNYITSIIILDVDLTECLRRNKERENPRPEHVLARQYDSFIQAKKLILEQDEDGSFDQLWIKDIHSPLPISIVNKVERQDVWENRNE